LAGCLLGFFTASGKRQQGREQDNADLLPGRQSNDEHSKLPKQPGALLGGTVTILFFQSVSIRAKGGVNALANHFALFRPRLCCVVAEQNGSCAPIFMFGISIAANDRPLKGRFPLTKGV